MSINLIRNKFRGILIFLIVLLLFNNIAFAYKSDKTTPTHQYITNESGEVWPLIPYEIKSHLNQPIDYDLDTLGYNDGEDIIVGSGEEDTEKCSLTWYGQVWDYIGDRSCPYYYHFWDPDMPNYRWDFNPSDYDRGWKDPLRPLDSAYGSSYRKARAYWMVVFYEKKYEKES